MGIFLLKAKRGKKEAIRVFERALNYSEIVDDYHTVIETKSYGEKNSFLGTPEAFRCRRIWVKAGLLQ